MIIAANSAISVPRPGIEKGTAANTEAIIVNRTNCDHRYLFLTLIFNLPKLENGTCNVKLKFT